MRYLFFILFVAMFLPNFGTGGRTDYGTFELSDLIVGPYLLVAFLIARKRSGLLVDQALEVLVVFLAWALIGALFITFRYHYGTDYYERFSLLKLAKFALYCAAGVATAMALTNEWIQRRYHWALLAAGVTAASGLLFLPDLKGSSVAGEAIQAYKSSNGMSVLLSMLACYLLALWLAQTKSPLWRRCALPCMGLMFLGGAVSRGRGGWVAGLMGLAYLGRRYGINRRLATSAALAVALIAVAYAYVDVFRAQVNYTLFPDPEHEKSITPAFLASTMANALVFFGIPSCTFSMHLSMGLGSTIAAATQGCICRVPTISSSRCSLRQAWWGARCFSRSFSCFGGTRNRTWQERPAMRFR